MDGYYDILLGNEIVGRAMVSTQGLYRCFDCACELTGEIMYRLTVSCGDKCENLGLPVPEGGRYVLRTKIPAKRLGNGILTLRVVPKRPEIQGQFIPVSPEEPFAYLSKLQKAVLEHQGETVGIRLRI